MKGVEGGEHTVLVSGRRVGFVRGETGKLITQFVRATRSTIEIRNGRKNSTNRRPFIIDVIG